VLILPVCVAYGSGDKQWLLHYMTLWSDFVLTKWGVFTVQYTLSP